MSGTCVRTVRQLVEAGIIERPLDGNHGELHPKTSDFVADGIPFVMASDLIAGRVDTEGCAFITSELAASLRKGFSKTGDVLLSHKGTIGRTAMVGSLSTPYIMLTPQVTYYRVLDPTRLDPRYLRFYFDSSDFQELLASWAGGGSTRAYLGITAQLDLPIDIPPIDDQRAIASVLEPLDHKIDLNRRVNRTLEELASAFFKSWFVDFDPVQARRGGREPFGVPRPVFSLFPAHFEDSELGPIPKGWTVRRLDQIADFLNGLALQNFPPKNGRVLPVVKIAQLRAGTTNQSEQASAEIPPEYVIQDGDVIFSWSGSLLVDVWCGGPGALNQHLFKVTSKQYPKWFFLHWVKEHLSEFQGIAADKATTMGAY